MQQIDWNSLYRAHVAFLGQACGQAITECGFDGLVLHAGVPVSRCRFDDQDWPLRPTPAFAHWLPLAEVDAALVLVPGAQPRLYRPRTSDFWEGSPPAPPEHVLSPFAVREVSGREALRRELPPGRLAFVGEDAGCAAGWGIAAEAVNPAALLTRLDAIRARKGAYERTCIATANARAARGHTRVQAAFASGDHAELALHLLYLGATAQDDAETPYKNIVAQGRNAATLHHVRYARSAPGFGPQSLLVDAGATCFGYASDVTRTVVKGRSEAAATFAELIGRIETLQQSLCHQLVPGLPYEQLHDRSHELLAEILRDLGLCRGSAEALVAQGVTRTFFPHGLGHSLGIQVHDVGCRPTPPRPENRFLRTTAVIAEGHVFTIEPGCYFIDPLLAQLREGGGGELVNWRLIDALHPFGGVRIEDNVAVDARGITNLTRDNWSAHP
jgi:Xaa-Pro dipeptidase